MTTKKTVWTEERLLDVLSSPSVYKACGASMFRAFVRAGAHATHARAAARICADGQAGRLLGFGRDPDYIRAATSALNGAAVWIAPCHPTHNEREAEIMTEKVWTLQDVSLAWRARGQPRPGFLQPALEAMGANCEAAYAAECALEQSMRSGAREANGEPNGQAFEAAARVLRGESGAPPSGPRPEPLGRLEGWQTERLLVARLTHGSRPEGRYVCFARTPASGHPGRRLRRSEDGAVVVRRCERRGLGPDGTDLLEIDELIPASANASFGDEIYDAADFGLAPPAEAKAEPPRPLGVVLSGSGDQITISRVDMQGVLTSQRIMLARPGSDNIVSRVVVGPSGRGWWSGATGAFTWHRFDREQVVSLSETLPGSCGGHEVYDAAEVEAYAAETIPEVPEWARTAEKAPGGSKVLRCTTLEVDCGGVRLPVTRVAITAPSGATVTYERDVMVVSDKAPEPDHERRAREAAADRREFLFRGVPKLTRNQAIDMRQLGIFAPTSWPEPETDDPYKAPRIRAIDAASNGGQQNLPPSRTLAEALSRARERRALALGGVRHLTAFAGAIDAAAATAEAPPHAVLCCELCGAAENDAVAERGGGIYTLTEMVRLPDGRQACEACARKAGAP